MLFDPIIKLYEGDDLDGATEGVIYLQITDFGRILTEIVISTDTPVSGVNAVFQLKLNGDVISEASAITVPVGNKISNEISGLNIELNQEDEFVLDLLSGAISAPLTQSLFTNRPVYTDEIEEVADHNYVTDAEKTVLGNTSGTNTGDETTSSIKSKLGITTLSGDNTGDQDLSGYATKTGAETLTNKTLTTPTIGSFANANHDHTNSAGGGTLSETALSLTDVTTNNASTLKHGFLPKLDNNSSHFLDGTGAWSTPAGGGGGGSGDMSKSTYDTNNNGKVDAAEDSDKLGGVAAASYVTKTGAETLTNKTLTAPAISSPTGLVKADVGLGNVDNTSDATKNSATATLTNKTFDAEGTGNVFGIPEKIFLPAAGVSGSTPAPFWDLPASSAPVATNVVGSNVHKGVLSFPDSGNSYAEMTLLLPDDWTGAIDAKIIWYTTATSGNCKWFLATSFGNTNASETDDNAYNTAQTVTTPAPGTANRVTSSSITSLTATGAGAGDLMHLKISRDGTDSNDTIGAAALLVGVELTIRRQI